MKNTLRVFALFTGGVVCGSAQLQQPLVANVPFPFIAGEKRLPPGEYRINPGPTPGSVTIRSEEGKLQYFLLTQTSESARGATDSVLVFHRYGDQYFLSALRLKGERIGAGFLTTNAEKRVAHSSGDPAAVALALNKPRGR